MIQCLWACHFSSPCLSTSQILSGNLFLVASDAPRLSQLLCKGLPWIAMDWNGQPPQ